MNKKQDLINSLISDLLNDNEIVFLIGNGLSLRTSKTKKDGLITTSEFVSRFQQILSDYLQHDKAKLSLINKKIKRKKTHKYSVLAEEIIEKFGNSQRINKVFKNEIIPIFKTQNINIHSNDITIREYLNNTDNCKKITLNPGLEAFGIIGRYMPKMTKIITSNFDPFIEIVFRKNNIDFLQYIYSYNLKERRQIVSSKNELIIEHYHGFWLDETAHSKLDNRNENKKEFKELIKKTKSIYVFGFGGWKDAFSEAINDYLSENSRNNCILHWAFYERKEKIKNELNGVSQQSFNLLKNIIDPNNNKVKAYYNINTNIFFPELVKLLRESVLFKVLEKYKNDKISELNKKEINNIFNKIPYRYGKLIKRDKRSTREISDFIIFQTRKNKSILVCSKFGLGKTTILENLFLKASANNKSYDYAILINLAFHELQDILKENKSLSYTVYRELDFCEYQIITEEYLNIIHEHLDSKKILLVLDGIDESIYKDKELNLFIKKLSEFEYPIITSVRLEFHDFIDNAIEFDSWDYYAVEIKELPESLLDEYLVNRGSEARIKKIKKLNILNKRPLFINLLFSLNDQYFEKVSDNIASLYYNIISYAIDKSINTDKVFKDVNVKKQIKKEYWDLLNKIAISIYLEFQHYKYEIQYRTIPSVIFSDENIRLLVSKNKFLDFESIKTILSDLQKDIIHLIKPIKHEEGSIKRKFTFFHRSLFEYLVANGATNKILRDGRCSEAWDVYQTDEVSDYFIQEINREKVFNNDIKKRFFFDAFNIEFRELNEIINKWTEHRKRLNIKQSNQPEQNKIRYIIEKENSLKLETSLVSYSERLEEVIYYIGKFKTFWNKKEKEKFKKYCEFLFFNSRLKYKDPTDNKIKFAIEPVYYRTSAITLSRLFDTSYIFDYISFLITDFYSQEKSFYYTQINKDIRYYGKEQLYIKSLKAFNEVLKTKNESDLKPLQILKIFSLFISLWYIFSYKKNNPNINNNFTLNEYNNLLEKLKILKKHCQTHNFSNMLDMLEGIKYIFDYISFDVRFFNISDEELKEKLNIAINKRKEINEEIFRIVNSKGDKLDYLEIDYYAGHIIIEAKRKYYVDKIEIIKCALQDFCHKTVVSISVKHNTNFNISSKYLKETFISGTSFEEIIPCNENDLIIPVKPKDYPKTGFFIDNRKIRQYIASNSKNKDVLNLCSFTCSLGAIAKKKGANKVINVDYNEKYIEFGKTQVYKVNGINTTNANEFLVQGIEDYYNNNDTKFDIIILDLAELAPTPSNFNNVSQTYRRHNQKALNLLNKNGVLITSCCSHGFSRERFYNVLKDVTEGDKYEIQENLKLDELVDHTVNKNDVYSDYLKIYVIKRIK